MVSFSGLCFGAEVEGSSWSLCLRIIKAQRVLRTEPGQNSQPEEGNLGQPTGWWVRFHRWNWGKKWVMKFSPQALPLMLQWQIERENFRERGTGYEGTLRHMVFSSGWRKLYQQVAKVSPVMIQWNERQVSISVQCYFNSVIKDSRTLLMESSRVRRSHLTFSVIVNRAF